MASGVLAAPAAARQSSYSRSAWVQVLVVVVLVAVAALVRWPNVHIVPPYTDETEESMRAWAVAQGEIRPLINVDAYIGALWTYVIAAGFTVLGRSPELPRAASLAAGALTVGVTYLLGRRLYGDLAGLTAALLLAGNAVHILVNSHVAWSNCVTPLFTTFAFWLLLWALDKPTQGWRLALAGLAWGLALQTHPSVIAFLVGAGVYALTRDRFLLRRPAAWVAILLAAVGYWNVLLYNFGSGFDTLTQALRVHSDYAGGENLDLWGYVASLLGVLVLVAQTTAGVVDPRLTAAEYLVDPRVQVAIGVLVAAMVWSVRRNELLLVCMMVPVMLVIPGLNQRWMPILPSRYIMPLLPVVLVTVAGMVVTVLRGRVSTGDVWGGAIGVAAFVTVLQLGGLAVYYQTEIAAGRSNDGAWRMVRLVEEQRRPREPLVVHADLHLLPMGGGGTWAKALDYVLTLKGVRADISPHDPNAHLRSCDVTSVVLRYVEQRDDRRRATVSELRYERYWIVRQAPPAGEQRDDQGKFALESPYTLPWRSRSLFDPRARTFQTGCE